jgi:hypothetical protein
MFSWERSFRTAFGDAYGSAGVFAERALAPLFDQAVLLDVETEHVFGRQRAELGRRIGLGKQRNVGDEP